MNVNNNILLTDFAVADSWSFIKKLREHGIWNIKNKQTSGLYGGVKNNIVRLWQYFFFPLQIVFCRKHYDKILAWQQFFGLNIAFWCRLFHLKKVNELTVMTFIYKRKKGVIGKLYHKYITYIVTSKYIDCFICFAKEECEYYSEMFGVDKDKFVFVPLGKAEINDVPLADEGYLFATGRSNRNYEFMAETLKDKDYQLIIACDTFRPSTTSQNVKVLNDCHGNEMLNLMAKCHCVVCPLKDLKTSSGQLVVLQAMALGKPVVCTKADGIKDYVDDEVTGFLVDNNEEAWMNALEKIYSDKIMYSKMCCHAKASYMANFTEDAMYERIAKIVNQY